jgi:hypothetical protein
MPTLTNQTSIDGWGQSTYDPSGSLYWALNNDWNNGVYDNTQWIDYNTSTFPNGTTINWDYGSHIGGSNVWGYPEIVYGTQGKSWDNPNGTQPPNWGEQIGTLGHFTMTWDISLTGNLNQHDTLAETFLSGHEFGFFLQAPTYLTDWLNGKTQYHFDLGGIQGEAIPINGSLFLIPDSVENGTPMTHGSVDFAPILQWAISQGWLSSSDQLKGFELGVEPQQGAGSMTVNNWNVDWGPGGSTSGSTSGTTTTTSGSTDTSSSGSSTGSSGSTTTTGGSTDTSSSGSSTGSSGSTTTTGGSTDTSSSGSSTDSSGSTTTTGGSSDTSSSGSSTDSSGSTTTTGGSSTGTSSGGSGTWTHHSHHWHSPWTSSTISSGATTTTGGSSTGAHSFSSHSHGTSSHSNTGASTATAQASTAASTAMAHAFTAASLMDHHDWLIGTNFTHHSDWA